MSISDVTSSSQSSRGKASTDVTVSIAGHLASAESFAATYREGMALVEQTAAYLDGQGRKDAKQLKAPMTVIYATESMRLTTRLLELASWLLIRRALNDGEITPEEARTKRAKVKLRTMGRPAHIANFDTLPERLRALIDHSFRLTDRISQLDQGLQQSAGAAPIAGAGDNPVGDQLAQLARAFNRA